MYVLTSPYWLHVAKLQPITFNPVNHQYLVLGERVVQAFHDRTALK